MTKLVRGQVCKGPRCPVTHRWSFRIRPEGPNFLAISSLHAGIYLQYWWCAAIKAGGRAGLQAVFSIAVDAFSITLHTCALQMCLGKTQYEKSLVIENKNSESFSGCIIFGDASL